ncbi:MAG: LptF/LptG family permease [Nitrospirae bacterium]|nr:LptF/LptG family permease [Nitrospirota bacterium]
MNRIQRLYLKDFFKLLFMLSVGLSLIFSLLDLMDKIHNFLPGKPSIASLASYTLYILPKFFLYLLPMSVLICSLFTCSQAFRRREIAAIKAAGGRLKTIFLPFILLGITLSIFAFITGEYVAPVFSKRAAELKNLLEGRTKKITFTDGGLWLKSKEGFPVKIDLYIIEKGVAKGITIFVTGKDFLQQQITADSGYWNGETWILEDIRRYDIGSGKTDNIKTMPYPNLESPDLLTEEMKGTSEMSISELYRYMHRLRNAGFKNIKLAVDLHAKISFPLINLFMMLLGISLPLMVRLGGGLFSAGLGLLISLLYWFSYTFSLSMGYAGIMPSFVSAWLIPSAFGMLAFYLYSRIPQ